MKKGLKILLLLLILCLATFAMIACGNNGSDNENGEATQEQDIEEIAKENEITVVPEALPTADGTRSIVAKAAHTITSDVGDAITAIIASNGAKDENYDKVWNALNDIRLSLSDNADDIYVYTFADLNPKDKVINMIVDASVEPDDFGAEYDFEPQFNLALAGSPMYAGTAWMGDKFPYWSAFAPILDGEGNVIAILGIDMPAPEVVSIKGAVRD